MTHADASSATHRNDGGDVSFIDFWYAIVADWRLVSTTVLIAVVASVALAFLLTPKFLAEAVIVENNDRSASSASAAMLARFGGLAQIAGIDLGDLSGKADNARATLHSRMLLDRFIRAHNLLPVLFADDWDEKSRRWTTSAEDTPTVWRGVKYFSEEVLVLKEDLTTGVISVDIEWTDPELAARWANDLVKLADEIVRTRALADAQQNVSYLNTALSRTTVVGLQQVLYGLLESEMKTIMLASDRYGYAFTVIDPAVVPELRAFPNRALVAAIGTIFGGFVAMVLVLVRLLVRNHRLRTVPAA